jgi:hypothetical protein
LQPDHRVEGEKQTRRSRREIDCGQAEGQLVGPVPQFPRAIEDGIDQYNGGPFASEVDGSQVSESREIGFATRAVAISALRAAREWGGRETPAPG